MRAKELFLVLVLPLVAGTGPVAAAATVSISNFTFQPSDLHIRVGDTVTFKNNDDIPHRVAAEDGSFAAKALDTDDIASVTFVKPGSFPYFCTIHPHMRGKITVMP